jgi:hypothetical protein
MVELGYDEVQFFKGEGAYTHLAIMPPVMDSQTILFV